MTSLRAAAVASHPNPSRGYHWSSPSSGRRRLAVPSLPRLNKPPPELHIRVRNPAGSFPLTLSPSLTHYCSTKHRRAASPLRSPSTASTPRADPALAFYIARACSWTKPELNRGRNHDFVIRRRAAAACHHQTPPPAANTAARATASPPSHPIQDLQSRLDPTRVKQTSTRQP